MAIPPNYDLNLYRGDSYRRSFVLWQDDAKTIPVDLTGAVVASQIRDKPDGVKIVDLGWDVTLPNTIEIIMLPAMYVDCPSKGQWDLEITFPDGKVQTVMAGKVTVTDDITITV